MRCVITLAGLAAMAAAHGVVTNITIGDKVYPNYNPFTDPFKNPPPQVIGRSTPNNSPVMDVTSIDIQCNVGSKPAPLHADVAAGSKVNLKWTSWPESHIGPQATYMARCPDTGCQDYMPGTSAVWFKVDHGGLIDKATNKWVTTPLMKEPNEGLTYTVPPCLAPGSYLVRHEIIAVFSANSYPGAQFYPTCHQLKVTGGGSTKPANLVAFPGAYQPADKGITWSTLEPSYPIPGPAPFTCDGAQPSPQNPPASPAAGTNPPTPSTPSTPSTPATKASKCKSKRRRGLRV